MDLHTDTTLTLMRIAQLQTLAATLSGSVDASSAAAPGSFAQQLAAASSALTPSGAEQTQPAPTLAAPADAPTGGLLDQYPRADVRLGPTNPRL